MGESVYEKYIAALDAASLLAQNELVDVLEKIDLDRPRTARDAVINAMIAIVVKYSAMSSLAAAEYYETERSRALGGDHAAFLAEAVPVEQIEASVRYAAGHLFRGDDDGVRQGRVRKLFDGES